jgi:hypothetical protein
MSILDVYGVNPEKDKVEIPVDQPMIYLSFYDLDQIVGFKSAKETNNLQELDRILWQCGLDISKGHCIRKCLHRPRSSNIPYDGLRFEGTERVDKEYLISGLASTEAKLFTEDSSLREALRQLDPTKSRVNSRKFEDDAKVYIATHKDELPCEVKVEDLVGFSEVEEGL